MGELDGQDDGLLEGLLGRIQPGDVLPLDVGLVGQDGARQGGAQLLGLCVFVVVLSVQAVSITTTRSGGRSTDQRIKLARDCHTPCC